MKHQRKVVIMFNVSPVNFRGKYQINANQTMPTKEACLKRDFAVGFWINNAENSNELQSKFKNFIESDYDENKTKPCILTFEFDNKYDHDFEETMNVVGQKFNKLA